VKIFYDISPFATRKDFVARPAGKMLVCSFGCLDLNDLIQSLAMWAMHQGKSCVFANHVGGPPSTASTFFLSFTLIAVKNSENMGIALL
jgi:hypothetical protein